LPDERQALTHKFSIAGHDGYITVGMYEDGTPGEIFIVMAKEGSTVSGLMDSFATSVSLALQYGVPLEVLVRKFVHTRFEPSGFTNNKEIPLAKSVMDYIFRWLALKFMPQIADEVSSAHRGENGANGTHGTNGTTAAGAAETSSGSPAKSAEPLAVGGTPGDTSPTVAARNEMQRKEQQVFRTQADAPPCSECGEIMVRNGACYKCLNCGLTSGCS
jgi:ribonucleoside-diphosphate reductase alpha chain